MFRRIRQLLGLESGRRSRRRLDLPEVDRAAIASFLSIEHGYPHPDWGTVQHWIESQAHDEAKQAELRRAVAAAWLDEVRDATPDDHRRWRHERVEGLAPMVGTVAVQTSKSVDASLATIERALSKIRGETPIDPIGVVALSTKEEYISFTSHYYPEEGHWGTSGGVYINDGSDSFPFIAVPANVKHSIDQVIAHELTHHALRGCNLPLWIEEGLTQMMEEHCTGRTNFHLNREMLERQRERWGGGEISRFLDGTGFHSAEDDEQELTYHLSQLVVRGLLARDATRFFEFARACRDSSPEDAATLHLDALPEELVERAISVPR